MMKSQAIAVACFLFLFGIFTSSSQMVTATWYSVNVTGSSNSLRRVEIQPIWGNVSNYFILQSPIWIDLANTPSLTNGFFTTNLYVGINYQVTFSTGWQQWSTNYYFPASDAGTILPNAYSREGWSPSYGNFYYSSPLVTNVSVVASLGTSLTSSNQTVAETLSPTPAGTNYDLSVNTNFTTAAAFAYIMGLNELFITNGASWIPTLKAGLIIGPSDNIALQPNGNVSANGEFIGNGLWTIGGLTNNGSAVLTGDATYNGSEIATNNGTYLEMSVGNATTAQTAAMATNASTLGNLPLSAFVQTNMGGFIQGALTTSTNGLIFSGASVSFLNLPMTYNPNLSLADTANGGNHFTGAYSNNEDIIYVYDTDFNNDFNGWVLMTNSQFLDSDLNNNGSNVLAYSSLGLSPTHILPNNNTPTAGYALLTLPAITYQTSGTTYPTVAPLLQAGGLIGVPQNAINTLNTLTTNVFCATNFGVVSGFITVGNITSNSAIVTGISIPNSDTNYLVHILTGQLTNLDLSTTILTVTNSNSTLKLAALCSNTIIGTQFFISPQDDTADSQTAINELEALGGGTLLYPPGYYWITHLYFTSLPYLTYAPNVLIEGLNPINVVNHGGQGVTGWSCPGGASVLVEGMASGDGINGMINVTNNNYNYNIGVSLNNLVLRNPANAHMPLYNAPQGTAESITKCIFDEGWIDEYNVNIPYPQYTNNVAIIAGVGNNPNGGQAKVDQVVILGGFDTGVSAAEHLNIGTLSINNCLRAFKPPTGANEYENCADLDIEGCPIIFDDTLGAFEGTVDFMYVENNAGGWWDATNLLVYDSVYDNSGSMAIINMAQNNCNYTNLLGNIIIYVGLGNIGSGYGFNIMQDGLHGGGLGFVSGQGNFPKATAQQNWMWESNNAVFYVTPVSSNAMAAPGSLLP